MKYLPLLLTLGSVTTVVLHAADPVPHGGGIPKIVPGRVVVPTGDDSMRRIGGELISLDLNTRTGRFRHETTDKVMEFTVLPYAELLHHATFGDLQDFRVGERATFRLHPNGAGEWVWLSYIQDEMNFLNNHKEYYHVDRIDAGAGRLECTDATADKGYVRKRGLLIETDPETRYWKGGRPAAFADIRVGDKLRTKTHGVGRGQARVCWEVFLDDESLLKFQAEQKAVHSDRMATEGAPGYVDEASGRNLQLTLFLEGGVLTGRLKGGEKVRVAATGPDRRAAGDRLAAAVVSARPDGTTRKVALVLDAGPAAALRPADVIRLWIDR